MAVQVSYPGVYIEEFAPGAPIEGVGTSTAAFLGIAEFGPPMQPRRITSWDGFLEVFRDPRSSPPPDDTDYLWYAVRGFFQNGGRNCYVMAVSNAKPDSLVLNDARTNPRPTVRVAAREARAGAGLKVKTQMQSAVSSGRFFKPAAIGMANASGNVAQVNAGADAGLLLPGDRILLTQGAKTESAVVARVDGDLLRLAGALTNTFTGGNIRLDAFAPGTLQFRAQNVEALALGSTITISQTGQTSLVCSVTGLAKERSSASPATWRVSVDKDVSAFDLTANSAINLVSHEFSLTVEQGGVALPAYDFLAMDPGHPRYFAKIINGDAQGLIVAESVEPPNTAAPPDNRPKQQNFASLVGGADFDRAQISASNYEAALTQLARIDDINLVSAPGQTDADVQTLLIAHCEALADRFALLDTPRGAPMFGAAGAEGHRPSVDSARGYAGLYYPWLQVTSVKSNQPVPLPPSGHVAGVFARIDGQRGVHKAPAGQEATLNGVVGVATAMTDDEQGLLNKLGVNVLRVFQAGGRVVVWGARTIATDRNWQYVNIRRLFLFLEESIQEGIRWAVFEPNNTALWQKLKRSITAFLLQQWRAGALFGNKAEEAFYVRIDEVLNPDAERALGRLNLEIGVRPSYPAEFIIVRIGIWQGGSEVSEG